jgi:predicted  nucleic acid-binding Zn-ribbon protein
MNKSLKEIYDNIIKQVRKMNKTVQELKMEIETIKKTQTDGILEMENQRKRLGTTDSKITSRIQEIEESQT